MKANTRQDYRKLRHWRIRKKVSGTSECPRLALMVSNRRIVAQMIDDEASQTLVGAATSGDGSKNVDGAKALGAQIGAAAKEKGISRFVVDRGGFAYHGRVRALVEGVIAAGLTNTKEEK